MQLSASAGLSVLTREGHITNAIIPRLRNSTVVWQLRELYSVFVSREQLPRLALLPWRPEPRDWDPLQT